MNRVVITGIGIASPVGSTVQTAWSNLAGGVSGVDRITLFDTSSMPVQIGGQVDDVDLEAVRSRFPECCDDRDRKVLLGMYAAAGSIDDSGISHHQLANSELHLAIGLEVFSLGDITPFAASEDLGSSMIRSILNCSDHPPLQTSLDRLSDLLGDRWGFNGGRWVNCSACAAGAQVIGEAFYSLRDNKSQIAIAGGSDSMLNPMGLGGFSLLRILSGENDNPVHACRPFDATRKGTVLGEGAAFLVLETLDHANARDAHIYGEILGYGSSMDAFRASDPAPDGSGAIMSMRRAITAGALQPEDIDCINAHGTGTPKNDIVETVAIREVMGQHAYEIPIHAVKSMTGHMIATSGAFEAVVAALTLEHNTIPPTINLENPDHECDLDYTANISREFRGKTILSNSFGFGGQNATLILGRELK